MRKLRRIIFLLGEYIYSNYIQGLDRFRESLSASSCIIFFCHWVLRGPGLGVTPKGFKPEENPMTMIQDEADKGGKGKEEEIKKMKRIER